VIKEVNHVTIEGYNGNEIVFSSLDGPREKDKRAEGLRPISAMGLEDNTGIGLAVQEKGTNYEVYQLKKMDGPNVKIMVPKGVSISITHSSPYGDDIKLKNIESEIEISTLHNGVQLENVTGPLTVKTVHGDIEANFGNNLKSPISLVSVHGIIDLTIPVALKANIDMNTNYGEMFVDPAIKIEFPEKSDWVKYGGNKIEGKVNGGGLDLSLSSAHGNIYLRKK
jgi:predicted membrane protein